MYRTLTTPTFQIIGCVLLVLQTLGAPRARAQQHLVRRFATEQGLAVPPVWALAQDSAGFLWVGTTGGLYRYDGIEFLRWAPDRIAGSVFGLATARDGRMVAQMENGVVYQVTDTGAVRMASPPGGWSATSRTVAFDDVGRLWTVDADGIVVYRGRGGWSAIPAERLSGEGGRRVRPAAAGGVYVLTDDGLWYIAAPDSVPRKRFDTRLADVLSFPDGRLLLLTIYGDVVEMVGNDRHVLASKADGRIPTGRPIALAERNGVIWVALDRYLVALPPGRTPEVIGPDDGLESGGPLFVDREGSLWLGSFAALVQYPEPETALWSDRDGLPSRHTRYVTRGDGALWVTTWQGTGRIRHSAHEHVVETVPDLYSQSRPCRDSRGVVWLSTGNGVVRMRGDRVIGRLAQRQGINSCAAAPGAGLWLSTDRGLLYADAERGTLRRVTGLPFGDSATIETVFRDRSGRLWATSANRLCHAPAAAVLTGHAHWTCDTVSGVQYIAALVELRDGTFWAASRQGGVLARTADGWHPLAASASLPSRNIFAMVPSPSGGIWIVGDGILLRVRPRGTDGWDVLEAPGAWNGLPAVGGGDLLEDADGTLWITTALGLLQVPPRARFAPSGSPPAVVVVDARVDAEPVSSTGALALPSDQNRLELHFAALTFRDPERVRYQVRLAPNARWSDVRGQPSVQWVDLLPGRYEAEVRASLDGVHWSSQPARFEFRVLPPWYRTPWALALFVALVGGVSWAGYRARLAFLLGLERQRTRIAMDLHDELGSGLGSMGILAGLLAGGRLDASQRSRIAREVAETAEELGSSLSDIVWSLDPRAATLEELVGRVTGHAERFFAGNDVEFTLRAPRTWPAARLPLGLRRNIFLIALEALHNAARHAGARHVTLAVSHRGPASELSIIDDGVGFGAGTPREGHRGRGVPGMRRRAEEMGATLEWRETPGGGTTVVLCFTLFSGARRRARWLGAALRRRS